LRRCAHRTGSAVRQARSCRGSPALARPAHGRLLMSAPAPGDITRLLGAAQEGDRAAFDELYRRVYDELHRLARMVRSGRGAATLNTTALVHEAYLKLVPAPRGAVHD